MIEFVQILSRTHMNMEIRGPVHEFVAKKKEAEMIDPALLDAPEPSKAAKTNQAIATEELVGFGEQHVPNGEWGVTNEAFVENLPDSAIAQLDDEDDAAAAAK